MTRLYSYVMPYDSGFAPNPFYGYCTLATCKPRIREAAQIGHWIVGTGSKTINRDGNLIHAMKVTEVLDHRSYWDDPRFVCKQPIRNGSRKQSCGDNIYFRSTDDSKWLQLDSFHSLTDGSKNESHVTRDTGVDRILISDDYYYLGGEGREIPEKYRNIIKKGRGMKCIKDPDVIDDFLAWLRNLGDTGYCGRPLDWVLKDG